MVNLPLLDKPLDTFDQSEALHLFLKKITLVDNRWFEKVFVAYQTIDYFCQAGF
jgi:hypothetical protein